MSTAYVLLSGGIDSTTCLYLAKNLSDRVVGVSFDYGQRHIREVESASKQCALLDVYHVVRNISGVIPLTMLTDKETKIPHISYAEIVGVSPTYVPFRNGLFLSAMTSYIEGLVLGDDSKSEIYFGAHAEDAQNWAYPDCTPEFIGAMANAIYIGSYRRVRLVTPLEWLDKKSIIKLGEQLGVKWEHTWSCYAGEEKHCGTCPTCRARRQGFIDAEVKDPTIYVR